MTLNLGGSGVGRARWPVRAAVRAAVRLARREARQRRQARRWPGAGRAPAPAPVRAGGPEVTLVIPRRADLDRRQRTAQRTGDVLRRRVLVDGRPAGGLTVRVDEGTSTAELVLRLDVTDEATWTAAVQAAVALVAGGPVPLRTALVRIPLADSGDSPDASTSRTGPPAGSLAAAGFAPDAVVHGNPAGPRARGPEQLWTTPLPH